MAPILTQAQLRRLDEHKYSCTGLSYTEKKLQVFWNWLVEKLPLWVAPNLITLMGFIVCVMTSLCVIYHAPTAKEEAPTWVYLTFAVGLFVYQILDNLDGKQARRTGSSTPLGQLFDEGCDAVSTAFSAVGFCCCLRMGESPELLFIFTTIACLAHYCAFWDIYVAGQLQVEFFDIVDAQLYVIAVSVVLALLGPSVLSYQVPLLGFSYGAVILTALFAYPLLKVLFCFKRAITAQLAGNSGPAAAGTSFVRPGFPVLCQLALAWAFYLNSSTNLFQNHPCLYLLMVGIATAKLSNKMVIASMTKSEMPMLDLSLLCPGLLFLNQCCNCLINEYGLLWASLIFVALDLAKYRVLVSMEICDYLDIYCFSITSKPSNKSSSL